MALSGTIYGPWLGSGYHRIYMDWSATQSVANNTSTITCVLKWQSTGFSLSSTASKDVYISIAGQTFSGTATAAIGAGATKTLLTSVKTVTHLTDGKLSAVIKGTFNLAFTLGGTYYSSTTTGDNAITLDTIPRYAAITSYYINSITRNTFKVNYVVDKTIDATQYSKDGAAWTTLPSDGIIAGAANGTHTMKIRVRAKDSQLWTESNTLSVVMVKTASANTPTLSSNTCIQAVINWSSSQTVTEVQYKIGSGSWVSAGTFTARTSGSFTIAGLTPGVAVTIYARVKDAVHALLSAQSGGLSVTTVALSSISTSADFNLESDLAVTISRPSTSLYHDLTLEAYYDSAWRAVAINTAQSNKTTAGSLSPTSAAVSTLFSKTPTAKSLSVRINMVVRWGASGTIQGTVYKSGTAYVVNANPTIASVSYLDISSAVQAVLANNQKILRNKSSLKVVAGAATSQKGATLANYKVTIGGNNYSVNAAASTTSESGKEIAVGAVNQSANQTVVLTVTDSRGNTATRSFTVQILDYQDPQILQAVPQRLNSYEAPTTMIIEGRRYTVKPSTVDVNEVYLRYRLKENPSGAYGAWITLTRSNGSVSGLWQALAVNQYMADYPNTKSYTVELQISDKFTNWVSTILGLSEGIAILRMMKDKMLSGVDLELLNNKGLILESPNGTRYILKVNDSGVITTAIA